MPNFVDPASGNGIAIYSLTGSLVKYTPTNTFWCSGPNPLPICSTGGFDGDDRALYDTGTGHWIITGLRIFSSSPVPTDLLAVSKTANPTAGWNLSQFPACGAFDNWEGSDQPHSGFNSQWIVVNSACMPSPTTGVNGAGLAVFDKAQLYAGNPLTLNGNWFEFVDPFTEGYGLRNNPVSTYTATISNREYLTVSELSGSQVSVVYSYIEGSVGVPVYYPGTEVVTPGFQVSSPTSVSAPGCTACMVSLAYDWIHSSGVWLFANGKPYVLSTMVLGDPRYVSANQVISIALNTRTGVATSSQLAGGEDGAGPMASEIALPLAPTRGADLALIAYDFSSSSFYPGVKAAIWDVDNNVIEAVTTLRQGEFTPAASSFQRGRWTDFTDAAAPLPRSVMVGGTLAGPSANTSQGATFWATVPL